MILELYQSSWQLDNGILQNTSQTVISRRKLWATKREILGCILALERWRPYFIGQPFEIVTDHACLYFFTSQPKLSRHQTHWLESLADCQPVFTFKRGKLHATPDALSRLPAINSVSKVSEQQALHEAVLIAYQTSSDQEFLSFKRLSMQSSSGFSWYDGLVFKKIGQSQCIVLPGDASQLKETVFKELHALSLEGHLGYCKLLALVNTRFWWPHMSSAVQKFCRQCILCQQTKVVTQKPLGLFQPLEPPSKLFEQVTMDLITHFPVFSGFDAVFTVVDIYSKYVTFLPCSTSSTAVDIAWIYYNNIVSKFFTLVKIVSGRDSKFLSKFQQSLMKFLQGKVALSSRYHL